MKEDLRKDMPKKDMARKVPVQTVHSAPPVAKIQPTPKIIKEEKSWTPPRMENKVSRHVEYADDAEGGAPRTLYSLWVVAGVAVVFLFFAVSFVFSKAMVTITPKTSEIPYNQNLQAVKDTDEETLSFDLVVLSGEEKKTLRGGEVTDLSVKARGTVVIYNNFSTATQLLAIDTRLEGSNGKIYKTEKALAVPGMKGVTPGSIEVGIYGSEAGEAYNSEPLDFTILGFKGTSKYAKFYARSKGNITGGFVGKGSVVSDGSKTNAINEMKDILQTKLAKKATEQIPPGFVLFPDASFLVVDSEEVGKSANGSTDVPISIKGTLYGFLFNEEELTKEIVSTAVAGDESEVFISNIRDLTFSLISRDTSGADVKNINFSLTGTPKVVWKFDGDTLAGELKDKKKSDFNQILSQYPNIDSADLILRPFWKRSFPSELKNINVTVNYPQ